MEHLTEMTPPPLKKKKIELKEENNTLYVHNNHKYQN